MTISSDVASIVGISSSSCRRIAASAEKRYKIFYIPKRTIGEYRQVAQPSREVKAVQRAIVTVLAPQLPVHAVATAYKAGSSILDNANRHKEAKFITKLDFLNFFPSIDAAAIAHHLRSFLPDMVDSDVSFILSACLWRHDGPHSLCIGAPSSPLLSNSVMFEFDSRIDAYAKIHGAVYTRYSDDITLSSPQANVLSGVEEFIRATCNDMVRPHLVINERKRVAVGRGAAMRVTGLTLSNQGAVTVGRARKRGVRAGINRYLKEGATLEEQQRLKGELAFVLSIEPDFRSILLATYGFGILGLLPASK